jgi:moderate conductance mechanosensitive channel
MRHKFRPSEFRPITLQRVLIGFWMSLLIVISVGSVAVGQIPRSPIDVLPSPLRQLESNLTNLTVLNDLLDSSKTEVSRGAIWLDGRNLFTIAAPALQDDKAAVLNPIESRVQIIEERLTQLVRTGFDPDSLRVSVEKDASSRQPVIYMRYSRNGKPQVEELMTVTALDAEVNGMSAEDWAEEVRIIVEDALLTAQQERQQPFLRQRGLWAMLILLGTGLLTFWLSVWRRQLRLQRRRLVEQAEAEVAQIDAAAFQPPPEALPETAVLLQKQVANRQEQRLNEIKRQLLQISQLLIWGLSIFLILGLFPYSRWLRPLILSWVQVPVRILIVVLVTYLAIRLSATVIDQLFCVLQSSTRLAASGQGAPQRLALRFTTFSRVAKSIAALVIISIGVIVTIAMLGVAISPALLTLTGIAGVGISLASQNLIKDVINGFLILLEDQFGVGDVISIGDMTGLVENMNLRITQLRSTQGNLITIPNSSITVVQNLSKEWSRVDLSVSVAYESDLDHALSVIQHVAQSMSHDADWQEIILDDPQVLGVENLSETGATVRLWIKTQPLRQWDVAREYRRRLKLAFDRAGISIGIPQQSLWLSNADGDSSRPTQALERFDKLK